MTVLHDDELPVAGDLVRALLARDAPSLADLPLRPLAETGSSNRLFRLGEGHLVRLPRQPGGTATIEKEARWGTLVAAALPVPTPEVVVVGDPGWGYPERWSVVRWLPGRTPDPASGGEALADDLAAVLGALRALPVPAAASVDPELRWYRGLSLTHRDPDTREFLALDRALGLDLDLDLAERVWDDALRVPGADGTGLEGWYHGDLFCENVLVEGGRLAGVLDLGGLAVGDPTVDLIVAWEVLDAPARERFRVAVGIDDAAWIRGRAWALSLALGVHGYYGATMPGRCATKLAVARAVLEDAVSD